MNKKPLSDYLTDPELKHIAKAHDLDAWHWTEEGDLTALAMMEGAAIAIKMIYQEGRTIDLEVHQSGIMMVWGSAYFQYEMKLAPENEAEVDPSMDFDDDPVVKRYKFEDVLTLRWDEGGEMFEDKVSKNKGE